MYVDSKFLFMKHISIRSYARNEATIIFFIIIIISFSFGTLIPD